MTNQPDNMVPMPGAPMEITPLMLLQPCPVQPATGEAMGPDGTKYVIDRYETPVGSFAVLLDPQTAIAHGEALAQRGRAASIGIDLPPGVRL